MTQPSLDDYRAIAPAGTVDFLRRLSERVRNRRLLNLSASREVGGVAEILRGLVPLLEEVGVESAWESVGPEGAAAGIGTRLHHALQGGEERVPDDLFEQFRSFTRARAAALAAAADLVVTHDALAAGLIEARPQEGAWAWRCHLDVSRPQRRAWTFLRQYVVKYDAAVFSLPAFAQRLPIPQFMIYPAIDPLSDKNRELAPAEVAAICDRLSGPRAKPILLQGGRSNAFKNPLGGIEAYRLVNRHHDSRPVPVGGAGTAHPEGRGRSARGRPGAARAARRGGPRARAAALPAHAPPGRHAGADGDARALSTRPERAQRGEAARAVESAGRGFAAPGTTRCARSARVSYKGSRAPRARRRGSGGHRKRAARRSRASTGRAPRRYGGARRGWSTPRRGVRRAVGSGAILVFE